MCYSEITNNRFPFLSYSYATNLYYFLFRIIYVNKIHFNDIPTLIIITENYNKLVNHLKSIEVSIRIFNVSKILRYYLTLNSVSYIYYLLYRRHASDCFQFKNHCTGLGTNWLPFDLEISMQTFESFQASKRNLCDKFAWNKYSTL